MASTETPDRNLFESLQNEFCPALDSSLIAALLFDLESDVDGNPVTPTSRQIQSLRAVLEELSLQADECFSDGNSTLREQTISRTTPSPFGMDACYDDGNSFTEYSQMSGSSSSSSSMSFSSPLAFLQMVLPDVPSSKLRKALENRDDEDIWDIIAVIVTEEAIREREERGFEGSENDGDNETGWEVVQRKRKETGMVKAPKKKTPVKLVLADIRQQHHEQNVEQWSLHRRHGSISGVSSSRTAPATVDPWTWISSLSSCLASLLPPHSPTAFSSFLHSPQYLSSYDAVRACLRYLCKSNELSDQQATLLINLLDVVMPEEDELDIHMRSQIISDVELAVCVTEGRGDNALDLVYLLRDLDGGTGAGLNGFHSQLPAVTTLFSQGLSSSLPTRPSLPAAPPDIPPTSFRGKAHPSSTRSTVETNTHQWQTVPFRTKATRNTPHYLGAYIPTYSQGVNGNKAARPGFANHSNNLSTSEEEVNVNANDSRLRMCQAAVKSRQALMDAAIMYQKRNSKNHNGEVAFYYAERAREWKQIAKREALNAAREMVLAKSERKDVIDLHGTTVAEALAIVREILNQRVDSLSPEKPLRIVTGKGNHSTGRVSVLKPALQNALTKDGWIVTTWDAGLVVRGVAV